VRLAITLLLVGACAAGGPADDESQLPPVLGTSELETWLDGGAYLGWHCETSVHASVAPSPHARNRSCANDRAAAAGDGELPVDSAYVKESYDASDKLSGRAVQRHTRAGVTGDTWFWYRRVPVDDTTVEHDETGLVASGWGAGTPGGTVCAACHATAGAEGHSGHDFVFDLVR